MSHVCEQDPPATDEELERWEREARQEPRTRWKVIALQLIARVRQEQEGTDR